MKCLAFVFVILLSNTLYSKELAIMSFGAMWCSPCQKMKSEIWNNPRVQNYLSRNNIKWYYVDIDQQPDVASLWEIKGVPTTIFIEKIGQKTRELERHVGYRTSEFIYYKLKAQQEALAQRKDTTVPS